MKPRYLKDVRARVLSRGRIMLPAELRLQDGVATGQRFEVERIARGKYFLVRRSSERKAGVVDWLLACPEKGFFVPFEAP